MKRSSIWGLAGSFVLTTTPLLTDPITWVGGISGNDMTEDLNWDPNNAPGPNQVGVFSTTDNPPFLNTDMQFSQDFFITGVEITITSPTGLLTSEGVTNASGVTSTFLLTDGAVFDLVQGFLANDGTSIFTLRGSSLIVEGDETQINGGLVQISLADGSTVNFTASGIIDALSSSSSSDSAILGGTLTIGNASNQMIEGVLSGVGGLYKSRNGAGCFRGD